MDNAAFAIPSHPVMPEPCIELLSECLQRSAHYLEYGSGGSTLLAMSLGTALIQSVESDRQWLEQIEKARQALSPRFAGRHLAHWIDIGPTGDWGYPLTNECHQNYWRYPAQPWFEPTLDSTPDLVLIDGRFRTACFFLTVLHAQPGTTILFDDYQERPHYHVVESVMRPTRVMDRMAIFVVDKSKVLSTSVLPLLLPAMQDVR